jgi:acylphosphatase
MVNATGGVGRKACKDRIWRQGGVEAGEGHGGGVGGGACGREGYFNDVSVLYGKCIYLLRYKSGLKAMQVRVIIIASGEVQRVGYRGVVERFARKMKLTGFVENIKPYDVMIVCEGNKASIDSFIRLIKTKEYPIDVENLDVKFEDATGEFEYFEIRRGDMAEELGERLDVANAKMTIMTQKQDVMIEKLDNNTSILKENTYILKENSSALKENSSILIDFKNETNENLNRLTNIMTKHDVDAQERIATIIVEISGIKDRLTHLELAIN